MEHQDRTRDGIDWRVVEQLVAYANTRLIYRRAAVRILQKDEVMIDATGYTAADIARDVCDAARWGINPLPDKIATTREATAVLRHRVWQKLYALTFKQIAHERVKRSQIEGTHDPEALERMVDAGVGTGDVTEALLTEIEYRMFRSRLIEAVRRSGKEIVTKYVELQYRPEGYMGYTPEEAARELCIGSSDITNAKKVVARIIHKIGGNHEKAEDWRDLERADGTTSSGC